MQTTSHSRSRGGPLRRAGDLGFPDSERYGVEHEIAGVCEKDGQGDLAGLRRRSELGRLSLA